MAYRSLILSLTLILAAGVASTPAYAKHDPLVFPVLPLTQSGFFICTSFVVGEPAVLVSAGHCSGADTVSWPSGAENVRWEVSLTEWYNVDGESIAGKADYAVASRLTSWPGASLEINHEPYYEGPALVAGYLEGFYTEVLVEITGPRSGQAPCCYLIGPGMSGSPVIEPMGRVIGILYGGRWDGTVFAFTPIIDFIRFIRADTPPQAP